MANPNHGKTKEIFLKKNLNYNLGQNIMSQTLVFM